MRLFVINIPRTKIKFTKLLCMMAMYFVIVSCNKIEEWYKEARLEVRYYLRKYVFRRWRR